MQGDDVTACPAGRHRRCGLGVGGPWGHWGPRLESRSRAGEAAWSSAPWPECSGKFRATGFGHSPLWVTVSEAATGPCPLPTYTYSRRKAEGPSAPLCLRFSESDNTKLVPPTFPVFPFGAKQSLSSSLGRTLFRSQLRIPPFPSWALGGDGSSDGLGGLAPKGCSFLGLKSRTPAS